MFTCFSICPLLFARNTILCYMRRVLVAAAAKISSVVTAVVHAADVLIVSLGALCNRSVTAVLYPANAWLIISI